MLSSRRVVTSRRAHPSRRAVSCVASRCLPSCVSWSVVPSSVVVASRHRRLISPVSSLLSLAFITSLSCCHRPSPHCFWLVVVFVPSPARRCSFLRCVASSPLTRGTVAALPHLSHCCVASCSPVTSLPSLASRIVPSPSRRRHLLRCVASSTSRVSSLVAPSSSRRVVPALPHLSFSVVLVAFVRVRYPLR